MLLVVAIQTMYMFFFQISERLLVSYTFNIRKVCLTHLNRNPMRSRAESDKQQNPL